MVVCFKAEGDSKISQVFQKLWRESGYSRLCWI
jgi:hypothetical protein